jgi:hypothetical protein
MANNRRTIWLAGLLGLAVVAAIVVWSTDDTGAVRTRPAATRSGGARGAAEAASPSADVRLDALKVARSEPADLGRNPFRFAPKAPPPPPPRPAGAGTPGPDGPAIAAPIVPSGPPPPPPITLKYIGLVEKADGTKIAVLSDGRRPLHGVEGQELDGQYRILKIGVESLEIAYLDGRGRQTIRLTGK